MIYMQLLPNLSILNPTHYWTGLFIGHRNQIEFFVRFKADRSLKCSLYDPYVYDVVFSFELLSWFHC